MFVFPYDGHPDRLPPRAGRGSSPDVWRWETTASVICLLLLPGWAWVTGGSLNGPTAVVLSLILGVGIGTGVSGARHGSGISIGVAVGSAILQGGVAVRAGLAVFIQR
jgi:hypothetical protein